MDYCAANENMQNDAPLVAKCLQKNAPLYPYPLVE